MTETARFRNLAATIAALRDNGVVPGISTSLRAEADEALEKLNATAIAEVAAYAETGNPDVLPELRQHLAAHLDEICRLLEGRLIGEFAFVAAHAERRAAQKFPLDAVLQTYRCLHRLMSTWVRDAALANADTDAHVRRVVAQVTDFTIEYTGAVGSLLTARYVDHARRLAEAEGDRRTALLNTLLDGYDESDQRAARLLRSTGYLEQRMAYCVAVARSVNPQEMENRARAERMVDAIASVLDDAAVRSIVGIRDNRVIAVMSRTRRLSGWTAPESALADRMYVELRKVGPAALIGLSNDVPSTSHIPRALTEAAMALEHASVGDRVMPYGRIPFRRMLIASARDSVGSALPGWLGPFVAADERSHGKLSLTLKAYADCDMNVQRTAKALDIHPNTIYARVQKIGDVTGLDPLRYHDLTEMLLAIACAPDSKPG